MRKRFLITFLAPAAALLAAFGCGEDTYLGDYRLNSVPVVKLTSGPVEGDTVSYRISFSWIGNDRDGTVEFYEFVLCTGDPIGFDPADTTGIDKWTRTFATDSTFGFAADEFDGDVTIGQNHYSRYQKTHTFFIRAVDDRGGCSEPVYRSFTAQTLAPFAIIEAPRNPFPGQAQVVPPVVQFKWYAEDPIDTPWNVREADSTRFLLVMNASSAITELNENPAAFENLWTPWRSYDAPGDSGTSTIIGDDEVLSKLYSYLFAVQAKDEAGAVTTIFDARKNVRVFTVLLGAGPLLKVKEPYLGSYSYIGENNRPQTFKVPAEFVVSFSWLADASSYGGIISSYRYGWDVADLNDPNEWSVVPSPFHTAAPPVTFTAGVHTLFIEATDNNGISTLAQMEVTFFPLRMDRNLFWIDDFYSTDFTQTIYAFPTETEHDNFWLEICSRAQGFSPSVDVFETVNHNYLYPDIETLWRYKNVIWTSSSEDRIMAWDDMVRFIPESWIGQYSTLTFNFLSSYMASGGHVWTEGKGDAAGGLAAVLFPLQQVFPRNLRCEITGLRTGCDGDTSGVFSMAYQDYCVTVLDKITQGPRADSRMPARRTEWDALHYGYRDGTDAETLRHPGLPSRLYLWDMVTKPGNFFDPQIRGFEFVELYNPAYWMNVNGLRSQSCFHPMFRMRTRNTLSALNNTTIAFWTTKYANVEPSVEGGVPAPSVHFGIPLWYFNRAQVDSIADVIFREWNISNR